MGAKKISTSDKDEETCGDNAGPGEEGQAPFQEAKAFDRLAALQQLQIGAHLASGLVTAARICLTGFEQNFLGFEKGAFLDTAVVQPGRTPYNLSYFAT